MNIKYIRNEMFNLKHTKCLMGYFPSPIIIFLFPFVFIFLILWPLVSVITYHLPFFFLTCRTSFLKLSTSLCPHPSVWSKRLSYLIIVIYSFTCRFTFGICVQFYVFPYTVMVIRFYEFMEVDAVYFTITNLLVKYLTL